MSEMTSDVLSDKTNGDRLREAAPVIRELLQAQLRDYSVHHRDDLSRVGMASVVITDFLDLIDSIDAEPVIPTKPKRQKLKTR